MCASVGHHAVALLNACISIVRWVVLSEQLRDHNMIHVGQRVWVIYSAIGNAYEFLKYNPIVNENQRLQMIAFLVAKLRFSNEGCVCNYFWVGCWKPLLENYVVITKDLHISVVSTFEKTLMNLKDLASIVAVTMSHYF